MGPHTLNCTDAMTAERRAAVAVIAFDVLVPAVLMRRQVTSDVISRSKTGHRRSTDSLP